MNYIIYNNTKINIFLNFVLKLYFYKKNLLKKYKDKINFVYIYLLFNKNNYKFKNLI